MPTRSVRRLALLCVVALSLLGTACEQYLTPPGDGPLRYRDSLFPTASVTSNPSSTGPPSPRRAPRSTCWSTSTGPTATPSRAVPRDLHPRRRLLRWEQDIGGDRRRGADTRHEGLRHRVDQLPGSPRAGALPGVRPPSASPRSSTPRPTQAAVAFLRAHATDYGIDSSRIAIAGTSAGAITAANVAFSNSDSPESAVRAAVSLSGAALLTTPDPGDAPLLLFHGTADGLVPYAWAEATVANATAAGVRAVLTTWEGAGHVPYAGHRTEILDQTRNFLYWHMDLAHAAA
ncbi:MAG: alpha/beta hydrolase fold domain-containing protein [Acidimicrobiales bacterium]